MTGFKKINSKIIFVYTEYHYLQNIKTLTGSANTKERTYKQKTHIEIKMIQHVNELYIVITDTSDQCGPYFRNSNKFYFQNYSARISVR